jgi:hypothetical protein
MSEIRRIGAVEPKTADQLSVSKQARDRFETLRESSRAETERLVEMFGDALAAVRESMGVSEKENTTGAVDASLSYLAVDSNRLVAGSVAGYSLMGAHRIARRRSGPRGHIRESLAILRIDPLARFRE